MVPTVYVKSLSSGDLVQAVANWRSTGRAAKHFGVSESFFLSVMDERNLRFEPTQITGKLNWTEEQCIEIFEKYRSVKFVARMTKKTEAYIRAEVNRLGLEIHALIDYSGGFNSNAKGRRAELDFAKIRGSLIMQDLNKTKGSQAEWDFDDADYKKVNVKSGRQFFYKAKTRKEAPHFWKFSRNGAEKADHFALMFYDASMNKLIGWSIIHVSKLPVTKSFHLKRRDIQFVLPSS